MHKYDQSLANEQTVYILAFPTGPTTVNTWSLKNEAYFTLEDVVWLRQEAPQPEH